MEKRRGIFRASKLAAVAAVSLMLPLGNYAGAQPVSASAHSAKVTIDPARLAGLPEFIDGVISQHIDTGETAGVTVAVVSGGKMIFSKGYGYADVDKGIKVDPAKTLFRPGSTSKLFTWTALMQLVEQGRVDMNADVNKYLDFKIPPSEGGKPILIKNLFDHTGGFEDRGGIGAKDPSEFKPLGTWLATNIPTRVREPGSESVYSNYATALAGYIVQRVSGEDFYDYVEGHIFKPLGMNHSTFREPLPANLAPNMAVGYRMVDGRFVAQPFEYYHNIAPAGSGSATATDIAKFMIMHLNDGRYGDAQILKPETARLMHSNLHANAPEGNSGFAHGFFAVRDHGPRMIGHGGNTGDFHSMLLLVPEADFGFFISYTGGRGSSDGRTELEYAIMGRLFPTSPAPRFTGTSTPPPAGSYRTNRRTYSEPARPQFDMKVTPQGAHGLVTESFGGKKTYWEQVGPRSYEKVTGAREGGPYDRIVFHDVGSDLVLSLASEPHVAYHFVKE